VKNIIVFLNKVDLVDDEEMHEIVEMEINELLEQYGFNPEETRFIRGSALSAMNGENPEIGSEKVKALLETMDEVIEVPERDNNLPFSVSIE
jgi:elongation factor Tu